MQQRQNIFFQYLRIALLFCVCQLSFAQTITIKFINYTVKDGLSQSSINCALQDSKGFMWFGTQDGLNKYDGYNYTIFKNNPDDSTTISSNWITCIYEDKQGNLWVGTNDGLNRYDKFKERFTHYEHQLNNSNSLSSNKIKTIGDDNDGNVWIGTESSGLDKFNPEKKSFEHYAHNSENKSSISNDSILTVYADKKGNIWVGTFNGGLNLFNKEKNSFTKFWSKSNDPNSISSNTINCISEDADGLWIGTSAGLDFFDKRNKKFKRIRNSNNEKTMISSLFLDTFGIVWLGTSNHGLIRYDKKNKKFLHFKNEPSLPNSLSSNVVHCIVGDRVGTMWIGTFGGLSKFDKAKQNFAHYNHIPNVSNTINNDVIWSILEDRKGALWVGTEEWLNRIDRENNSVRHYKINSTKLIQQNAYCVYEDQSEILWIGAVDGLYQFDRKKEEFILFKNKSKKKNAVEIAGKMVRSIVEDKDHNLWIGSKDGVFRINYSRTEIKLYQHNPDNGNSLSDNFIRVCYQDKLKNIWFGTFSGGLNKIVTHLEYPDSISFKRYMNSSKNPNEISNNKVLSIYEFPKGTLWIGTAGGLNKMDIKTEKIYHLAEKDGLSNNTVYGILSDKKGNLWCSTNKGISRFNPKDTTFQNYYENDGLQSDEFNAGATFKNKKGELFFGGINGFNVFDPEKIAINQLPPQIVFTDFQILNTTVKIGKKNSPLQKSITETDELILSYKQNFITIGFAALHYSVPEKNQYTYMMEGVDEEWVFTKNKREASYPNLSPGEYIFKVKAANSDGVWNENEIKLKIIIEPPFWKTWWFIILIIIFILGGIYAIYLSRVKLLKRQQKVLEYEVDKRTRKIRRQKQRIEIQTKEVEKEKEKVEKLLHNILPQDVAEELKIKGKASARHYRLASVMFTDIKGFTKIAETFRPKDLVDELDRCFIKFDEIIEKYGVEKIKTIGDSYMCVGGVPIRNKSNPVDVVLAGLEIQRYMEELKREKMAQNKPYWELRIGINTGSLIAGVVGTKRFAYDVWGDMVNLASRMENKGEVGKVNISEHTHGLIKDYFDCSYRGKVEAKHKGEVDMFFVDRIKSELSVNGEGIIPNEIFKSKLATALFYRINYEKAEQFILQKLEKELPKNLHYHAVHHTIDVRNAAENIGKSEGIEGENMMILKTAAMFHDAGFIKEYFKNEHFGVEYSREILPSFGYSPQQIMIIEKMIMATRMPQSPETLLEKILCDADLDYLGRDDFHEIAETLKQELIARGRVKNDKNWDEVQINFLMHHNYFTETNIREREPKKQKNIAEVRVRYQENQYV